MTFVFVCFCGGRQVPLCMCRSQDNWQESVLPFLCVDPGKLGLSLSDLAGSVSAHRGSTSEGWHEPELSCLPKARHKPRTGKAGRPVFPLGSALSESPFAGHAAAPCYDVVPFQKQAFSQELPELGAGTFLRYLVTVMTR